MELKLSGRLFESLLVEWSGRGERGGGLSVGGDCGDDTVVQELATVLGAVGQNHSMPRRSQDT